LEAANDKAKPRTKTKRPKPRPPLAVPGHVFDFFAEAREQIATGKARGKIKNPINNFVRNS
jgi:hypothetical protein